MQNLVNNGVWGSSNDDCCEVIILKETGFWDCGWPRNSVRKWLCTECKIGYCAEYGVVRMKYENETLKSTSEQCTLMLQRYCVVDCVVNLLSSQLWFTLEFVVIKLTKIKIYMGKQMLLWILLHIIIWHLVNLTWHHPILCFIDCETSKCRVICIDTRGRGLETSSRELN